MRALGYIVLFVLGCALSGASVGLFTGSVLSGIGAACGIAGAVALTVASLAVIDVRTGGDLSRTQPPRTPRFPVEFTDDEPEAF
jgi:hypothetical protein